ncbi:cytochrome P450 [Aspergillus ellipticus CBS 707.79]|uniref:Cytochrome P450 n=1 Tax=Aspergillus ellipticus CBS 707.79 TaxID=1448320 RepID=A0A319DJX5_9EURO|nr:cytochrome P450 [Aspergillus ellipticus CBS 707.79]
MALSLLLASGMLAVSWTAWCLVSLLVNITRARATTLPSVILPCSLLGAPWLLTQPLTVPCLRALPAAWTASWLPLLLFNDGWHNGYEPFERVGADTFLAVSPGGLILYTCDAEVSTQLFRDGRFGKPAHLMQVLNIFGPTMTGTDGAESRLYRRIAAPFFNEATMRQVFSHSVQGGEALVPVLSQATTYPRLRTLAARLSLNMVSRVCYHSQDQDDLVEALRFEDRPQGTHRMSYSEAMHTLLDNYMPAFLLPKKILELSPLSSHRNAGIAFAEMAQYMQELKSPNQSNISPDPKSSSLLDLLTQAPNLQDPQITGQIWLFQFAGHEANANTLTFIILLLACHPVTQRSLQHTLDTIVGDFPSSEWTYDAHYKPLMNSLLGGIINEALRLFTVLPVLPKHVPENGPAIPVTVKGNVHAVPAGTVAFVNTSATHRHPRYWPRREGDEGGRDERKRPFAVSDFWPERWVQNEGFLTPEPGTFVPFSEGARGCLGYRFALVELCAVVARLFKENSVRLLTRGEEGGEDGVWGAGKDSWEKARERAELALSEGVRFDMSLRVMRNVPVRFETRVA